MANLAKESGRVKFLEVCLEIYGVTDTKGCTVVPIVPKKLSHAGSSKAVIKIPYHTYSHTVNASPASFEKPSVAEYSDMLFILNVRGTKFLNTLFYGTQEHRRQIVK